MSFAADLAWLDAVLAVRIAEQRAALAAAPGARTQYVSHEEADWLLATAPAPAPSQPAPEDEALLAQRAAARPQDGPLAALAAAFALTPFERDALLVCLAPELDRRYDKLYAYLQDDAARRRPTADLVLTLLRGARARLTRTAPLLRHQLLTEIPDPASPSGATDLARFLAVEPRVLDALLGADPAPDPRLHGIATLEDPATAPATALAVDPDVEARVLRLTSDDRNITLALHGPDPATLHTLALRAAARAERPLLRVDARALTPDALRLIERERRLTGALVLLEHSDDDTAPSLDALAPTDTITFLATRHAPPPGRSHPVAVPAPPPAVREAAWRASLAPLDAPPAWAPELAQRFRLTPAQIAGAVATATVDDDDTQPTLDAIAHAARAQSRARVGTLAVPVEARATWADLVLPDERVTVLRELCAQVRHQHDVLDGWGFADRISRARGVSALFTGPPGTGKTLAAEVIAHELGLDLHRIDLSGIVSKWIGETEKNLDRIFAEAESTNSILFFDEADALFGKRTKVSDAHDRYANIETSYLLTRMESHDGVVILATNLRENLDDAFTRRIRFVVDFPFPDAAGRRAIWATHLPERAPVDPDLDLDLLAAELKVPGGSIRNIVLGAAFLAAGNGRRIEMSHVAHATRREFEKIGKLWDGERLR